MKSISCFIRNDDGFFMPLVLLIVALMFITVGTSIKMYRDEIVMTEHLIERIQAETMLQMANEKRSKREMNQDSYQFPYGSVTIKTSEVADYFLHEYDIYTQSSNKYTMRTIEKNEGDL